LEWKSHPTQKYEEKKGGRGEIDCSCKRPFSDNVPEKRKKNPPTLSEKGREQSFVGAGGSEKSPASKPKLDLP